MKGGLVIGRKPGEDFVIGDDIRITILRVKGQQCRIHIVAPRGQTILRGELEARGTSDE